MQGLEEKLEQPCLTKAGQPRKRNRRKIPVKQACAECRRRHVACDENRPCTRCVQRGCNCEDRLISTFTTFTTADLEDHPDGDEEDTEYEEEPPIKKSKKSGEDEEMGEQDVMVLSPRKMSESSNESPLIKNSDGASHFSTPEKNGIMVQRGKNVTPTNQPTLFVIPGFVATHGAATKGKCTGTPSGATSPKKGKPTPSGNPPTLSASSPPSVSAIHSFSNSIAKIGSHSEGCMVNPGCQIHTNQNCEHNVPSNSNHRHRRSSSEHVGFHETRNFPNSYMATEFPQNNSGNFQSLTYYSHPPQNQHHASHRAPNHQNHVDHSHVSSAPQISPPAQIFRQPSSEDLLFSNSTSPISSPNTSLECYYYDDEVSPRARSNSFSQQLPQQFPKKSPVQSPQQSPQKPRNTHATHQNHNQQQFQQPHQQTPPFQQQNFANNFQNSQQISPQFHNSFTVVGAKVPMQNIAASNSAPMTQDNLQQNFSSGQFFQNQQLLGHSNQFSSIGTEFPNAAQNSDGRYSSGYDNTYHNFPNSQCIAQSVPMDYQSYQFPPEFQLQDDFPMEFQIHGFYDQNFNQQFQQLHIQQHS